MTAFSSDGSEEEPLPHLSQLILDNQPLLSARDLRASVTQLQHHVAEQTQMWAQFAEVARAFERANDLAQGLGRPNDDQARDRLGATDETLRSVQLRWEKNRQHGA